MVTTKVWQKKAWKDLRKEILDRDDLVCWCCGRRPERSNISIHHLTKNKFNTAMVWLEHNKDKTIGELLEEGIFEFRRLYKKSFTVYCKVGNWYKEHEKELTEEYERWYIEEVRIGNYLLLCKGCHFQIEFKRRSKEGLKEYYYQKNEELKEKLDISDGIKLLE